MEYKCKSLMLVRIKDRKNPDKDIPYDVELKLFNKNDSYKTDELPVEELTFENVKEVYLLGFDIKYLPRGNDLVMNDLNKVKITRDGNKLTIFKL